MDLDVRKGQETAAVMTDFLSRYMDDDRAYHQFYKVLANRHYHSHYNFVMVTLYWCYELHRCEHRDESNEQSVLFARDIVAARINQDFDWRTHIRLTINMMSPFVPKPERGDISATAEMFYCLLGYYMPKSGDSNDFVHAMLRQDRTVQQTFTRFCCKWCRYVVEQRPPYVENKTVEMAKLVVGNARLLPSIQQ